MAQGGYGEGIQEGIREAAKPGNVFGAIFCVLVGLGACALIVVAVIRAMRSKRKDKPRQRGFPLD